MFQEELYTSLRACVIIDAMQLTEELIQQPMLLLSASESAADIIQLRDACKNALDIANAEAARLLRTAVDDNGKAYSEQRILSMTPLNPKVQEAAAELEEARHSVAYWQALVDAFTEKGSALRRIAELTTSGYITQASTYADRRQELSEKRGFKPRR